MKAITKYVADDDTEFSTREAAVAYEELCREVDNIMQNLQPRPEGTDFANGSGYIQHNFQTFLQVRESLLKLINRQFEHSWIQQSIEDPTIHPSWVGKLVSEMGNRALNSAWYRIQCTDAEGREWGQPYYAAHPEEAVHYIIQWTQT